ncbi:hypothetical protein SCLCIDRAFT_28033 [Scleroderma citrinum Foug A]|uniref:Uncharacterized protein n=1 Tax=Scleroderma citrinum Foug A TaxID=1036808 RepID=A0A0C3DCN9_9AGAM|nr:hypothetical protein SCLCIDRAFT_28033 [Scleroderma citrinum Foug A]
MLSDEVAKFFEPSVEAIVEAFSKQQSATSIPIKHAFLVGGYAASDYLFMSLQQHPKFSQVTLCRPANHVNKVVADGAVSFHIDHLVTTRVAKVTYGVFCSTFFQSGRADHVSRANTKYRSHSGSWALPNAFQSILKKVLPSSDCSTIKPDILQGTQVSEQQEFRSRFSGLRKSATNCTGISTKIIAYRGSLSDPRWRDIEPASFTDNCKIFANASNITTALLPKTSPEGQTYYSIEFGVILLFGLTELKAQMSWLENVRVYPVPCL